jgi:cation diffusion facilitator family transporter
MLILVGSGVIVFEAIRHLVTGSTVDSLGVGIAVIAFSALANVVVSNYISRRAKATDSPALEGDAAHLRTDALTSTGVLAGLVLVHITGANWIDPVVALGVAVAIVFSGVRLLSRSSRALVDEALPAGELDAIRETVTSFAERGVVGFHQLRTRRAGALRHVDMHVQFRVGTSLEQAHSTAHALQDAIEARLGGADVLIHLEPADRVRPGDRLPGAGPGVRER